MAELQHILCIKKEKNKMKVKFTYLSDNGKMWKIEKKYPKYFMYSENLNRKLCQKK